MMTSSNAKSNFSKHSDPYEEYWNDYLKARPSYEQPFYQSLIDYHQRHDNLTEIAHDVATGPGQVAARLSSHFNHVIASDINPSHFKVAEQRLGSLVSSQKVSLVACAAEDLADKYPPNTADFIAAAECLPLMDAPRALQAFSTILKSNGTLAIWFYGRPIFAEIDHADTCQPLLDSILDLTYASIIQGAEANNKAGWRRATNQMASYLDDLEFKDHIWKEVERRKWNSHNPMPFFGPEACDFEVIRSSAIQAHEKVVEEQDAGFWESHWDIGDVKRFVLGNSPVVTTAADEQGKIESKWGKLKQAMGGERGTRKITWPVVLILATKRE